MPMAEGRFVRDAGAAGGCNTCEQRISKKGALEGYWADGFDKSVWGSMIQAVIGDLQIEERCNE